MKTGLVRVAQVCSLAALLVGSPIVHASETSKVSAAVNVDVMFYNVFNLFDAQHDEGKEDWTFLPKGYPGKAAYCESLSVPTYKHECLNSDWNDENLQLKLKQIKTVVDASTERLPDMMGLSEVENANVVGQLAKTLGFESFAITESPDARGIDVALMYNTKAGLKFVSKKEHVVSGGANKPTRNVLEVEFAVSGERLLVFVNHWPSQAAPGSVRTAVAKIVHAVIDQRLKADPTANVLVMGDFNTTPTDNPHPFNTTFLDHSSKNPLADVHDLLMSGRGDSQVKWKMPNGTYFYPPRMSWDRLDRFFVSETLRDGKSGLTVASETYRIMNPDVITKPHVYDDPKFFSYGTTIARAPYRANIYTLNEREAGFSDHFPIFVSLRARAN
jgi:endonuclease/exonuclease/phosphatase family metal-dependent hydrolase